MKKCQKDQGVDIVPKYLKQSSTMVRKIVHEVFAGWNSCPSEFIFAENNAVIPLEQVSADLQIKDLCKVEYQFKIFPDKL
ncbi:hypothetical protein J0S82_011239, partial [Galemys pyrenaicus]